MANVLGTCLQAIATLCCALGLLHGHCSMPNVEPSAGNDDPVVQPASAVSYGPTLSFSNLYEMIGGAARQKRGSVQEEITDFARGSQQRTQPLEPAIHHPTIHYRRALHLTPFVTSEAGDPVGAGPGAIMAPWAGDVVEAGVAFRSSAERGEPGEVSKVPAELGMRASRSARTSSISFVHSSKDVASATSSALAAGAGVGPVLKFGGWVVGSGGFACLGGGRCLEGAAASCPLAFNNTSETVNTITCQQGGLPSSGTECCSAIEIEVLKARAAYAAVTGTIFLDQQEAAACAAAVQVQFPAAARCNISLTDFIGHEAVPNNTCGNYTQLASLVADSGTIMSSCYQNYASRDGTACSTNCSLSSLLTSANMSRTDLLANVTTPLLPCTDALAVVLVSGAPDSASADGMAACLTLGAGDATCRVMDWGVIDYSDVVVMCQGCAPGNAGGGSCQTADMAVCCSAVLQKAVSVWAMTAAAGGGGLFPPVQQMDACFDEFGSRLAFNGLPGLLETCGFTPTDFLLTSSNCGGRLTVAQFSADTADFRNLKANCSALACDPTTCVASISATAVGLASAPSAPSSLAGCSKIIWVAYLSRYASDIRLMDAIIGCRLGRPIVHQDASGIAGGDRTPSWKMAVIVVGAVVGGILFCIPKLFCAVYFIRWRKRKALERNDTVLAAKGKNAAPASRTSPARPLVPGGPGEDWELGGPGLESDDVHPLRRLARMIVNVDEAGVEQVHHRHLLAPTASPPGRPAVVSQITAAAPTAAPASPVGCNVTPVGRDAWGGARPPLGRPVLWSSLAAPVTARVLKYEVLEAATGGFAEGCRIGRGGFGNVYLGLLDGEQVAVKRLEGRVMSNYLLKQFLVEVDIMHRLNHPHLLPIIGFCAEGEERLLVYPFMPNGSLHHRLHSRSPSAQELQDPSQPHPVPSLDWPARVSIALGAARALFYLHEEADPQVIHRDFKSSNILLDEGDVPRVSDFGLAKLMPDGEDTKVTTRLFGTAGYVAPEYIMGKISEKTDVYAFGVVLLELITGLKAVNMNAPPDQQMIVSMCQPYFRRQHDLQDILEPSLRATCPPTALAMAIDLAAACTHDSPCQRPSMASLCHALTVVQRQQPLSSSEKLGVAQDRDSMSDSSGTATSSGSSSLNWLNVRSLRHTKSTDTFFVGIAANGASDTAVGACRSGANGSLPEGAVFWATVPMSGLIAALEAERQQRLPAATRVPSALPASLRQLENLSPVSSDRFAGETG